MNTVLAQANVFLAVITEGKTPWYETPIGKWIAAGMMIVGSIIVVVGVAAAIKDLLGGKIGGAVKKVISFGVVAAFFLDPALINQLIGLGDKVINLIFQTGNDITPQ